jgi:hypothetical protein
MIADHTLTVTINSVGAADYALTCRHPDEPQPGTGIPTCRRNPETGAYGPCFAVDLVANLGDDAVRPTDPWGVKVATIPVSVAHPWTSDGVSEVDAPPRVTFPAIPMVPENRDDWHRISVYNQLKQGTAEGDAHVIRMLADWLSTRIEREDIKHPGDVAEDLIAALHCVGVALARCPGVGDLMGGVHTQTAATARRAQDALDAAKNDAHMQAREAHR